MCPRGTLNARMGKKGTSGGAPAAPPLVINKRSGVVSQPQPAAAKKRAAPEPDADAADGEGGGGGGGVGDFDLDSLFKKGKAGKKVKDAEAAAEVGALPRWSPPLPRSTWNPAQLWWLCLVPAATHSIPA